MTKAYDHYGGLVAQGIDAWRTGKPPPMKEAGRSMFVESLTIIKECSFVYD